ncbi:hypothetical protein [Microvirga sp. M2]|uniref:hypothetical protein n=1 Tax=Microvirga sp. M2 TaxID=3073270 RepID=UPI0039C2AEA6
MRMLVLAATTALLSGAASAQMAHQFTLIGHIESFTVDDMSNPLSSAKMKVHGAEAVLPSNLIIQMPARYLTAKDIVDLNPKAPGANSGLALNDTPPPLSSYEATVVGNIVNGQYVAGLVWISQHSLATGSGFIKEITPQGEIHLVADPDAAAPPNVTRIRINDPHGIYAPPDPNADERFMVDEANPTIHAGTGYPMCIQQALVPTECPAANRPLSGGGKPLTTFVMGGVGLPGSPAGAFDIPPCPACDPSKQAPLRDGDFVTFSGTLARDQVGDYVSVHTLEANVGIYTAPGADPAYVFVEGSLIGTQGPLMPRDPANPGVTFPQETQDRLKIEGVTTDPSRRIELYAIDVDATTGDTSLRLFNTVPAQPAPLGRFRLILGARANALFDADNTLRGAPRELLARVERGAGLEGQPVPVAPVFAHGLVAGQYVAPFGEFIFPENKVFGDPVLPNNFACLPFLLNGSGPLETTASTGPVVGPLDPWPDVVPRPATVECGPRPKPVP